MRCAGRAARAQALVSVLEQAPGAGGIAGLLHAADAGEGGAGEFEETVQRWQDVGVGPEVGRSRCQAAVRPRLERARERAEVARWLGRSRRSQPEPMIGSGWVGCATLAR